MTADHNALPLDETSRAALAAHGAETQADIPNFTDVAPVIQISEVVVGQP